MNLIECPACGTRVPDYATECPHCGNPRSDSSSNKQKSQKMKLTVWDGVRIGCGIYIVLPIILVVISFALLILISRYK